VESTSGIISEVSEALAQSGHFEGGVAKLPSLAGARLKYLYCSTSSTLH